MSLSVRPIVGWKTVTRQSYVMLTWLQKRCVCVSLNKMHIHTLINIYVSMCIDFSGEELGDWKSEILVRLICFSCVHFYCCYSVAESCPTFCDLMDCSTPGFPVLHHLPEFAQTHVPWVGDAIQPSCPLSPPSPPVFSLSQHQGLFQWVSSSHQVARVLELQLWHRSFRWRFGIDFLYNWLVWSACSPRDCQKSSPTLWFKSMNSLALILLYSPTLISILLEKP